MKTLDVPSLAAARALQARIDAALGYPKTITINDPRTGGTRDFVTDHACAILEDPDAGTVALAIEAEHEAKLTTGERARLVAFDRDKWDGPRGRSQALLDKIKARLGQ